MESLSSWLQHLHAEHLSPCHQRCSLYRLGLRDLLQIHKRWRLELESNLLGSAVQQLDIERICCDNSCITGQWLHGPGRERFGHLPGWLAACRAHTRVHQYASELVMAHHQGADTLSLTRLEHRFKNASSQSQLELVRLFGKSR